MVVQHTMSWFGIWRSIGPGKCDMWPQTLQHIGSAISSENQVRKCGNTLEILFGPAHVFLLPCTTFRSICLRCWLYSSIFAFVQDKHICIASKTQKGQQSQFMKKKNLMPAIYNALVKVQYSLNHSCREMHITPIMHSRYLSDFLHLQMCLLLTEGLSQTGYSGLAVFQAWWCRAECTIPSDSRHVRTAGWNREISVSYYGVDWLHTSESVSHQEWGN